MQRHLVALSEGDVEVFTAGGGSPLVLLHPFNIGAGFFGPQFAALADRHRVISVHHSGVGATTAAADLSVEGLAELLRRTLDALDVRGPVHLAGASFGALPAMSLALRHPHDVASLTLIGGSYRIGNRQGEMNRLALVAREDFDHLLAQPGTEPIAATAGATRSCCCAARASTPGSGCATSTSSTSRRTCCPGSPVSPRPR